MPNIKSAKKRVKTTIKKTKSNEPVKGGMNKAIKRVKKDSKKEGLLSAAMKKIDKALKKGIIKKNTAARKKSRLAKSANVK
jgi:small subunit ribosomal protein S20